MRSETHKPPVSVRFSDRERHLTEAAARVLRCSRSEHIRRAVMRRNLEVLKLAEPDDKAN